MKKCLLTVLLAIISPGIVLGSPGKYTALVREKQRKMAELEKCMGSTKGLKIAGLSTLGLTAVGVAGNIAQAGKRNEYDSKIASLDKKIEREDSAILEKQSQIATLNATKNKPASVAQPEEEEQTPNNECKESVLEEMNGHYSQNMSGFKNDIEKCKNYDFDKINCTDAQNNKINLMAWVTNFDNEIQTLISKNKDCMTEELENTLEGKIAEFKQKAETLINTKKQVLTQQSVDVPQKAGQEPSGDNNSKTNQNQSSEPAPKQHKESGSEQKSVGIEEILSKVEQECKNQIDEEHKKCTRYNSGKCADEKINDKLDKIIIYDCPDKMRDAIKQETGKALTKEQVAAVEKAHDRVISYDNKIMESKK